MKSKTPEALAKQFTEKYRDVENKDAASRYYGSGNVMDAVLGEMQRGIDAAAAKWQKIKKKKENKNKTVYIHIAQERYEIQFSTAEDEHFYLHDVGEAMAEALVLLKKMDDSGTSTGLAQALCNWADDLDFSKFSRYEVSDDWELMEGYEEYGEDDEDDTSPDEDGSYEKWIKSKNKIDDSDDFSVQGDFGYTVVLGDCATNRARLIYHPEYSFLYFKLYMGPVKVQYPSVQQLRHAISDFKAYCKEKEIYWERSRSSVAMAAVIEDTEPLLYTSFEKPVALARLYPYRGHKPAALPNISFW